MAEQTQEPHTGRPASVYDFLIAMVDSMAAIAWQKLGLQHDMITGKIEKDLGEAKVAIDITTHLSTFIHDRLDESDRRKLENLIKDLRLNYVEKRKEEESTRSVGSEEAASSNDSPSDAPGPSDESTGSRSDEKI